MGRARRKKDKALKRGRERGGNVTSRDSLGEPKCGTQVVVERSCCCDGTLLRRESKGGNYKHTEKMSRSEKTPEWTLIRSSDKVGVIRKWVFKQEKTLHKERDFLSAERAPERSDEGCKLIRICLRKEGGDHQRARGVSLHYGITKQSH